MSQDTNQNSSSQPSPFKELDALDYFNTLAKLVDEGELYSKTKPRFAFPIRPIVIETEGLNGETETLASLGVEHFVVMHPDSYPTPESRRAVHQALFKGYALNAITEADVNDPDFKGADVWTMPRDKFLADYKPDPSEDHKYLPKTIADGVEPGRFIMDIDEDTRWHVPWGTFDVRKGGAIAVRESELKDLKDAVAKVKVALRPLEAKHQSKTSAAFRAAANGVIQKMLYEDPQELKTKLDVYGMVPGFRVKNYELMPK